MRVGITYSTFDLLHTGHIAMLKEAKSQCDYLICGLQTDPSIERPTKNKPIQSVTERYIQLNAVKYVDEIIPYTLEQDLFDILHLYDIDVRIIGEEYRPLDFSGKDICDKLGIEIYFNRRNHQFSTTNLRNKITLAENSKGLDNVTRLGK